MNRMSIAESARVLLAACGNIMAGDDGFGPMVLKHAATAAPPGIELVDLSLQPAALLDHLPGPAALILIDSLIAMNQNTYQLLDLDCTDPDALPLILGSARSSHALGLGWQLVLARSLGVLPPRGRLITLSIPEPAMGRPMSAEATAAVPRAAAIALKWARSYIESVRASSD